MRELRYTGSRKSGVGSREKHDSLLLPRFSIRGKRAKGHTSEGAALSRSLLRLQRSCGSLDAEGCEHGEPGVEKNTTPYSLLSTPWRGATLALFLIALGAVLSGCGGPSETSSGLQPITLTLDWYPNADHAGIYLAQSEGFFEDAGLEVEIRQPSDPAAVLQLVAAGQSEFGVSYENEMTNAAVRDIPVQSVMAIMQEPLNSIISLEESDIAEPEDLAGKQIGYAGQTFGTAVIDTVLTEAGEDPAGTEKINVGLDLRPALTSGRVDAVVDAYWNIEAVELAQEGFETNVIKLPEVGVPNYNELVVATNDAYAEENPEVVRRFVGALVEGHEYALNNPEAARDALIEANEELDPEVVDETLDLTVPIFEAERIGYQDPEEWQAYVDWAVENGVLQEPVEIDEVMTNEFLP